MKRVLEWLFYFFRWTHTHRCWVCSKIYTEQNCRMCGFQEEQMCERCFNCGHRPDWVTNLRAGGTTVEIDWES